MANSDKPYYQRGIQHPRLILCEGPDDAMFLRKLREARSDTLKEGMDIRWVRDLGGIEGNSGFERALIGSVADTEFDKVTHIAIISDSDTHCGDSFSKICAQIEKANKHPDVRSRFHVPKKAWKASGGKPKITVLLLPKLDAAGCLETLLWQAMADASLFKGVIKHVEDVCVTAGIANCKTQWPLQKQHKARVHIALALANEKNPGISLTKLFMRQAADLPFKHPAFDQLVKALSAL